MSKYPVEISDNEGISDALNYLLSGPGGLGQNFAGVKSSEPNWVTGNFRTAFLQPITSSLYVPAIDISLAEMLDLRTYKYTFATTQSPPPFSLGNGISVEGFSDPQYNSANNSTYQIGVIECTTTYFVVRSINYADSIHAPESSASAQAFFYSTARNVTDPYYDTLYSSVQDLRVTVTGGTDRVFVNAQSDISLTYTATTSGTAYVVADIERWVGQPNNDPTNPDYFFQFQETIIYKTYSFSFTAGTHTIDTFTNIFTNVVDQPKIGYYRYFYNFGLGSTAATIPEFQFTTCVVNARSMATQVVKA